MARSASDDERLAASERGRVNRPGGGPPADGEAGPRSRDGSRPARRAANAEGGLAPAEGGSAAGAAGGSAARIGAPAAAKAAMRQIVQLTAKEPEGVTAVQRGGEGWLVGVEVVEDRRIPSSSDMLAVYETELDDGGELMSYRRIRRYSRGRGGNDEGN